VEDIAIAAGLRHRFDVPESVPAIPLDATHRHGLYLATKEVLNNILKHANASEIRFSVAIQTDRLLLTIEDDGCGFDTSRRIDSTKKNGLLNLKHRLTQLGGTCSIRSVSGVGTSVDFVIPFSN
jgi:signal transduction histidine kinase